MPPDDQWARLVTALKGSGNVIIDAGTGRPPRGLRDLAQQSLLVTRPCFIAIRRAQHMDCSTDGCGARRRTWQGTDVSAMSAPLGVPVVAECGSIRGSRVPSMPAC